MDEGLINIIIYRQRSINIIIIVLKPIIMDKRRKKIYIFDFLRIEITVSNDWGCKFIFFWLDISKWSINKYNDSVSRV
jgi:hypothetical protein